MITKPNTINEAKQAELKEAGYLVVEAENPKDIIVLDEFGDLDRDLVLCSALESLAQGNDVSGRLQFSKLIREGVLQRRKRLQ